MGEISTTKKHGMVLVFVTMSCLGAIVESISQGWEFWVPPLIVVGVVFAWTLHIKQSYTDTNRENYYLVFSLLVAFYHGVHQTSFFDIIAVSALFMTITTLLRRQDFLRLGLFEFFLLIIVHIVWAYNTGFIAFDALNISRILLHCVSMSCVYRVLSAVITESLSQSREIAKRDALSLSEQIAMEDFLVNISHELRTPVNVIIGICSIILKKENREDISSIRDAGRKMFRQIENIQDYSEIQRGNVTVDNDAYATSSLWEDMISEYKNYDTKQRPELCVDLDPTLPSVMRGDVKKLQKILRHLLDNSYKFTQRGGVYVKISGIKRDYGLNLMIEVTDTGCGMTAVDLENAGKGGYQANSKRNRDTGGIGLGLSIVYGFARCMDGFVSVESEKNRGTTVRVSVAQDVVDASPTLSLARGIEPHAIFYLLPGKFKVAGVREFYSNTATNLAKGLNANLFFASSLTELKSMVKDEEITHVFMGEEEYLASPNYFDEMVNWGITVVVSARAGFEVTPGSKVFVIQKPLYGYSIVKFLNGEAPKPVEETNLTESTLTLDGIRALIVDDEPMNLVVAKSLFREYNMNVDTANSGKEAVVKITKNDYDIVFMDYMMPEMDGIEALKRMQFVADQKKQKLFSVAISANAVGGVKDLFLSNGFDGYIPKPIQINEFESVMKRLVDEGLTLNKEVKNHA